MRLTKAGSVLGEAIPMAVITAANAAAQATRPASRRLQSDAVLVHCWPNSDT